MLFVAIPVDSQNNRDVEDTQSVDVADSFVGLPERDIFNQKTEWKGEWGFWIARIVVGRRPKYASTGSAHAPHDSVNIELGLLDHNRSDTCDCRHRSANAGSSITISHSGRTSSRKTSKCRYQQSKKPAGNGRGGPDADLAPAVPADGSA